MTLNPDALYRAHGPCLFQYLMRMSGDADVASDVLQDTFRTLLERPPHAQTSLRGWLFRVATNRLRDEQRGAARRLRMLPGAAANAHSDPQPSPDRAVIEGEARAYARALLESLPERDRQILLLREEGFTHREIAEQVGTTTKSVGTLIARALDRVSKVALTPERTS